MYHLRWFLLQHGYCSYALVDYGINWCDGSNAQPIAQLLYFFMRCGIVLVLAMKSATRLVQNGNETFLTPFFFATVSFWRTPPLWASVRRIIAEYLICTYQQPLSSLFSNTPVSKHNLDVFIDLPRDPKSINATTKCPTSEDSNVKRVSAIISLGAFFLPLTESTIFFSEGLICLTASVPLACFLSAGPSTVGIAFCQQEVSTLLQASHPKVSSVPVWSVLRAVSSAIHPQTLSSPDSIIPALSVVAI